MTRHPLHTFAIFSLLIAATLSTQLVGVASADVYSHMDNIANRIDRRAKQVVRETKRFEHTPEYIHLVSDAQEISRLAKHIHDVTHFEGNLAHLEADLAALDSSFHHLESVFDRVEHNAAFGYGHVHGSTRNLRRLLNLLEDDLHHLQEDVASLRVPVYYPGQLLTPAPPFVAPAPVIIAPAPIYGVPRTHGGHGHHAEDHGIGFSIGGGRTRINFRF